MNSIVFFGSGPVAAQSLELLAKDFEIEAVITKPKPLHHRGDFPVITISELLGLKIFTPANKHELNELFQTKPVQSRIGVVIDYGLIISQEVIDYFPLGIVNSHFSLLPEWRGADPITFSILSGQQQTGISLMLITAGLDEGPLLAQASFDMPEGITTPQLTDSLIDLSHKSLVEILPLYVDGSINPVPQETATISSQSEPTYSRKLTKEDGVIDWHKPAQQLEREVRAYIEWPKSSTTLGSIPLTITKAAVHQDPKQPRPGELMLQKSRLWVGTGKDWLEILSVKPDGKKEMPVQAFLAGYRNKL
jgi:methionyl-tRNA formyltransferase